MRFGAFPVPVLARLAGTCQADVVDAGGDEGMLRSKKLQHNPDPDACVDCSSPAQLAEEIYSTSLG